MNFYSSFFNYIFFFKLINGLDGWGFNYLCNKESHLCGPAIFYQELQLTEADTHLPLDTPPKLI